MADLLRPSFIKICGVTSIDDATLVRDAGADAFGLIVAPSSRRVTTSLARSIAGALRASILCVLVTRDLSEIEILRAVDEVAPDGVQLHDPVSPSLLSELGERDCFIIRALATTSPEFDAFDDRLVNAVLVDGPDPGRGVVHAWEHVERRTWSRPLIAAGGLTSINVADVIEHSWVWGVDVATSVEREPGVKDPAAVRSFVTRAREAFEGRS